MKHILKSLLLFVVFYSNFINATKNSQNIFLNNTTEIELNIDFSQDSHIYLNEYLSRVMHSLFIRNFEELNRLDRQIDNFFYRYDENKFKLFYDYQIERIWNPSKKNMTES